MLFTNTLDTEKLMNKCCVDYFKLEEYLKPNWGKEDDLQNLDTVGYVIYINNLEIFNEGKEISNFHRIENVNDTNFYENDYRYIPITNSPRNMMYAYDNEERKIIIPVSSEEMCRIANGEQTTLVRKIILNEMKKGE